MQSWLVAAALFIGSAYSTVAANADVITIGRTTFDFDAPFPPLTAGQEALFRRYQDAVNQHDEAALMSLQDASINSCATVARQAILQDMDKTIPDDVKVRFFDATEDIAQAMGLGDVLYLSARPTAVLGIVGSSKSEREIKIVTILRPVRQTGEAFAFVPYCLTEKGKALLERKDGTQQR
jgi:hypothetical protein